MLQPLLATLDKLIELQKQLIGFADKKRTVLIERKIDDLDILAKKESELLKQLGDVEAERQQLAEELLKAQPDMTFKEFIEGLPDSIMRKKLQARTELLQQLLLELQAKNKTNEHLLLDSMNFVQHMIEQVTKSKQQHFNYQSPLGQQKQQTSSRGFFDTKA